MIDNFFKVKLLLAIGTLAICPSLPDFYSCSYNVSSKQIKKETSEKLQFMQPLEEYDINVIDSEKSFDA